MYKTSSNLFEGSLEDKEISGQNYYLELRFSDKSLTQFDFMSIYSNGKVEPTTFNRSTRIENNGRFFWEFSDEITDPLENISINLPSSAQGTLDARICQKPE
ncbi:MAG: alginate biosynthesis protein AlgX [Deinococcales bacterium]